MLETPDFVLGLLPLSGAAAVSPAVAASDAQLGAPSPEVLRVLGRVDAAVSALQAHDTILSYIELLSGPDGDQPSPEAADLASGARGAIAAAIANLRELQS